ncbi:transposase [Chamaesiphon sp.]|uniref:transposase n=1 Tax=Chamaesiphon sp. TaxID=2814140 RepID=UPI0035930599
MVFLDETGLLLGLMRHHARSEKGSRVYDLKPFYRGKKVTVIGAISISKVLAVMTLDNSMDSNAFHVFIEKLLLPQLWSGAVVIMDNLSAILPQLLLLLNLLVLGLLIYLLTHWILIQLNIGGHSLKLLSEHFLLRLLKWSIF